MKKPITRLTEAEMIADAKKREEERRAEWKRERELNAALDKILFPKK